MKNILLAIAIIFTAFNANAVDTGAVKYELDKPHTNIIWFVDHFGYSQVFGYFKEIDGNYWVDQVNPVNSKIDITVKIDSLTTSVDKLTEHLKGKDFFEADKYPEAKFVSTKVSVIGKDSADVTGNLTLHGVTKPIVLNVKLNAIGDHPFNKKPMAGFMATSIFKRSDFGMTSFLPGVGDSVKLIIQTEGIKTEDAPKQ